MPQFECETPLKPHCPTEEPPTRPARNRRGGKTKVRAIAAPRAKAPKPIHAPKPTEGMITVPLNWFWDVFRGNMTKLVRPPTAKTRRKEMLIKEKVPMDVVYKLLEVFETDEIPGLKWEEDSTGARVLKPTKGTTRSLWYEYNFKKGPTTDKLWRIQESDKAPKRQFDSNWRH